MFRNKSKPKFKQIQTRNILKLKILCVELHLNKNVGTNVHIFLETL